MRKLETNENIRGITLIALIITIVVLIILAGVGIYLSIGNNGIFNKVNQAKTETIKQAATEKMNLKITNMQIEKYGKEQRMPTLQEFADGLCEDDEIQYVELQSKKVGSLNKIMIGNANSIFTKLKDYPYEFEINSSLQLASIDGVQVEKENVSNETLGCNPKLLTTISLPDSLTNIRGIGKYNANTTSFNKTNTSEFDKYLSFDEKKGWTVLKSGNYMIGSYLSIHYYEMVNSRNRMLINEENITLNTAAVRKSGDYITDYNNTNVYLEKGALINFDNLLEIGAAMYHNVELKIYALFK